MATITQDMRFRLSLLHSLVICMDIVLLLIDGLYIYRVISILSKEKFYMFPYCVFFFCDIVYKGDEAMVYKVVHLRKYANNISIIPFRRRKT